MQPEIELLMGDVPSPIDLPAGCAFHTRCPHARERCREELPKLRLVGGESLAACHFAERLASSLQPQPAPLHLASAMNTSLAP